jgi:hypothetical protein
LLGLWATFSERGANTAKDANFFSEEKFERARCLETGWKRRMCGHICATELRGVSRFVSETWTARDSSARVELKKLSASGSALATEIYRSAANSVVSTYQYRCSSLLFVLYATQSSSPREIDLPHIHHALSRNLHRAQDQQALAFLETNRAERERACHRGGL